MKSAAFKRWRLFFMGMLAAGPLLWVAVQWGSARTQVARTERELHELAVVLEHIKVRFGSYPRVAQPEEFYDVIMGRRDPTGKSRRVESFFNPSGFSIVFADPDADGNSLLDSWGRPYGYLHRPPMRGREETYILYSLGPDGRSSDPASWGGDGRGRTAMDADNIYAQ